MSNTQKQMAQANVVNSKANGDTNKLNDLLWLELITAENKITISQKSVKLNY